MDPARLPADGLHGIFEQVDEHLPDEVGVGIHHEVGRLYLQRQRHRIGQQPQLLYLSDQLAQAERFGRGLLQGREFAVAVYKRHQPHRGVVNGPDALIERRAHHVGTLEEHLAQRGDGRNGVHDFVRQHPCQPHPRVHLLALHRLADVVQGEHPHPVPAQLHPRGPHLETDLPLLRDEPQRGTLAGGELPQDRGQPPVPLLQLAQRAQGRHIQQPEHGRIGQHHLLPLVEHDDARSDARQNQAVKTLALLHELFLPAHEPSELVQRVLQDALTAHPSAPHRQAERIIAVADGLQHQPALLFQLVPTLEIDQHRQPAQTAARQDVEPRLPATPLRQQRDPCHQQENVEGNARKIRPTSHAVSFYYTGSGG